MRFFWEYRRISNTKFLIGLLLTCFCLWYMLFSEIHLFASMENERKLIFIIAIGRSGSSLIGEMFNQLDDEFLYIFEPLKAVINYHGVRPATLISTKKLQTVTREKEEYMRDIMSCYYRPRNDKYIAALGKQFVGKSKAMQKVCGGNNCRDKKITSEIMNQVCREYKNKHIVVKELYDRFPYEEPLSLDYLKQHANGRKLYVLNSVRDPRAIFNSHRKLGWLRGNDFPIFGLREDPYIITRCSILNSVLQHFTDRNATSTPYYSLRFEDISNSGKALASFLNLGHLAKTFENFLHEKTKSKDDTDKANLSLKARNINKVIEKWRKTIQFSLVQKVQKHCQYTMKKLGYKLVDNEEELHDLGMKIHQD